MPTKRTRATPTLGAFCLDVMLSGWSTPWRVEHDTDPDPFEVFTWHRPSDWAAAWHRYGAVCLDEAGRRGITPDFRTSAGRPAFYAQHMWPRRSDSWHPDDDAKRPRPP